jgi:hypothetical protein
MDDYPEDEDCHNEELADYLAERPAATAPTPAKTRRQRVNVEAPKRRPKRSTPRRLKPRGRGRPRLSFAEKVRRSARPHETAGEVVYRFMRYGASLLDSARELERRGYRTPSGKLRWTARQAFFEYCKARAAKGQGPVGRKIEVQEYRRLCRLEEEFNDQPARLAEIFKASLNGWVKSRPTYPLRTKVTTVKDRALAAWHAASEAARLRGEPGPPQPTFDNRGRPRKGRRLSRVKRKVN